MTDDEIYELAKPIWDNLVKSSNLKDYGGFTKTFQHKCFLVLTKLSLVNSGQITK
jgi:hypothetical protein